MTFEDLLHEKYGPVMDAKAVCSVLYYPSPSALAAAKSRGRLPFTALEIEGRPGYFAVTSEIAALLDRAVRAAIHDSSTASARPCQCSSNSEESPRGGQR
jgi:hypothetical protein